MFVSASCRVVCCPRILRPPICFRPPSVTMPVLSSLTPTHLSAGQSGCVCVSVCLLVLTLCAHPTVCPRHFRSVCCVSLYNYPHILIIITACCCLELKSSGCRCLHVCLADYLTYSVINSRCSVPLDALALQSVYHVEKLDLSCCCHTSSRTRPGQPDIILGFSST